MKTLTWAVTAVAVLALSQSDRVGASTQHMNKAISVLEVPTSSCYFFQLEGVAQADAAVSSVGPWFAISTSHPNAKELYALLLSVRASGGILNRVLTSGNAVCSGGGAEVLIIDF